MNNYFKDINADYQITDLIENIDILRILRENKAEGCEYVFIFTEHDFVCFLAKSLAKRLEKIDIANINPVINEEKYGFVKLNRGSDIVYGVTGNVIRSTGYVKHVSGSICSHRILKSTIDNLELIESVVEEDRQRNTSFMETIKVIAG